MSDGPKIVVVGSVAAGTTAAAKARRGSEDAEIVVYERDRDISYSGCGLPFYLGGVVESMDDLTPRDPSWFAQRYAIDVRTGHEVTDVDARSRTITVQDLATGETFTDGYDELVLATGVSPVVPPLPGVDADGVFTLRNPSDARAIRQWIESRGVERAVVVGAGYIGLEAAEQLTERGLEVTVVEQEPHAMPSLDADVADRVDDELRDHGVELLTRARVTAIETADDGAARAVVVAADEDGKDRTVPAGLVIVAVGVRPNLELAEAAGVRVGETGAIAVDRRGRTSVEHVWAVGDVAESFDLITGEPVWVPLGSTANKMGRITGDVLTGGDLEHRGILGTSIVRVFDLAVAQTGLSEDRARAAGFDPVVVHNIKPDRPEYLGGQEMLIKAVADRVTGRLLGAQIVGPSGVDKRVDVLATAISFGARAEDLFHLDLAYAPPFSTTKDPVHYTGMALDGAVSGRAGLVSSAELDRRRDAGGSLQVVDLRSAKDRERSSVDGSVHIPLAELRARAAELDAAVPTIVYCNKGVTANAGQNVLRNRGFADVANLSGGNTTYQRHLRGRGLSG
ncbi:FAD-dependent oxidoreductase [Isoptericola sp. b515]|uniref:FAD-dependent oxidoreductase n=1 Tax=Isoptericola sp. b515 TaxID=3064652 RepID=UPI002712AD42|nr:FAD-dependent oxidoreductase [Isoptericola sp. b515]MDO8147430.1 FAD-dependent oxidoreductase [Isoptericola sp. b515]